MVCPAIKRRPKPYRDHLGYGGVQRHQPLPPAQLIQPQTPKLRPVKDTMNVGSPEEPLCMACPLLGFLKSRAFASKILAHATDDIKARAKRPPTRMTHMDFVTMHRR